jgi:hypothetical protein
MVTTCKKIFLVDLHPVKLIAYSVLLSWAERNLGCYEHAPLRLSPSQLLFSAHLITQ